MSYMRDPDKKHRGVGAIASRDAYAGARERRDVAMRRRLEIAVDRRRSRMTMGGVEPTSTPTLGPLPPPPPSPTPVPVPPSPTPTPAPTGTRIPLRYSPTLTAATTSLPMATTFIQPPPSTGPTLTPVTLPPSMIPEPRPQPLPYPPPPPPTSVPSPLQTLVNSITSSSTTKRPVLTAGTTLVGGGGGSSWTMPTQPAFPDVPSSSLAPIEELPPPTTTARDNTTRNIALLAAGIGLAYVLFRKKNKGA